MAVLTKDIAFSVDKSLPCQCVFADVPKAFDTVSHKRRSILVICSIERTMLPSDI